jgi:hypothetical protein
MHHAGRNFEQVFSRSCGENRCDPREVSGADMKKRAARARSMLRLLRLLRVFVCLG